MIWRKDGRNFGIRLDEGDLLGMGKMIGGGAVGNLLENY